MYINVMYTLWHMSQITGYLHVWREIKYTDCEDNVPLQTLVH